MLGRRKKELQSLLEATRKSLGMAENKAEKLTKQVKELNEENHALYEENKELRSENENAINALKRIRTLTESNTYNNGKIILDKIKELAKTGIEY